jgi:glycosyltransferase involved in cell wall biosynthesis
MFEDTEERKWFDHLTEKTQIYLQQKGQIDISLQITIPNEWERMAPVNIGYTAGIESTRIAPEWVEKSALMDKIIVTSNHAKSGFDNTSYDAKNEQTGEIVSNYKCTTPLEVVNYAAKDVESKEIDIDFDYDFNFLVVSQWGPRKNLENTVRWFFEEFVNDEVGLVLKVTQRNNALMDRIEVYYKLQGLLSDLKNQNPGAKCKIYLLHGDLTDEEMTFLYRHPKIKSLISLAHGEGFGLPIFEASYNDLPVICPSWGGQVDFLYAPVADKRKKNKIRKQPHFATVDYALQPVQPEAVWGLPDKGQVLIADSMWCFAHKGSYKNKLRDMYKNHGQHLSKAKKLKKYVVENFSEEKQYKKFANCIVEEDYVAMESWLENLEAEVHA